MQLVYIALGGALGALSRYGLSEMLAKYVGRDFPWGTFVVNMLGSLLIGLCYVLIVEKSALPEHSRALLMSGFLGALTTFSTFSLETLSLIESSQLGLALFYVCASVLLCLLCTYVGMSAARYAF